ncbi:MAG: hypothetical protein ACM3IJ_05510 [Candidatus Levyibacteriota bacterium]
MIYILHGDDVAASRTRLGELTSEFASVTTLDGEKATTADLVQALSTSDLFLDAKCVVVEKVLRLPKKEMDKLLDLIFSNSNTIILWHNTELSKTFFSKVKQAKVEVFMLPKLFFTFLDGFYPGNFKRELDLLQRMENVEAEQIFYALVKRMRQMLHLKLHVSSEELSKMSPWQMGKVQDQAGHWELGELEKMYGELFGLEKKIKTSGLALPLKKHLDFLLI